MKTYDEKHIKNIALIGAAKSGKTTLAETMLFEAGILKRRGTVEERNTVSDYHEIEQERQSSVYATLLHTEWKDYKINIVDTPGIDDFIAEVITAIRICDTAVIVLNAQHGVENGTEVLFDYIDRYRKPTLLVMNQLDHEHATFWEKIEQVRTFFGPAVTLMQYPLQTGPDFHEIIDLLKMTLYRFGPGGGKPEKLPIPEAEAERAARLHNELVEKAAENDERLMELYFEKGNLDEDELREGLSKGMMSHQVFPLFCLSAKKDMGSGRLMGFIDNVSPSPVEMPSERLDDGSEVDIRPDGPGRLLVFKTLVEPHLGKLSLFKVISGEVAVGSEWLNENSGTSERLAQLFILDGKNRQPVDRLKAGDIGATLKLKNTQTGDTLNGKNAKGKLEPISFPEPNLRMALKTLNAADDDKLGEVLGDLHAEDPGLIFKYDSEVRQMLVYAQGELHLAVTKWRLKHIYRIEAEFIKPRISYRETIQKSADSSYRHKKQSGGAGQFGEVFLRVEPWTEAMSPPAGLTVRDTEIHELHWGGKMVFLNCITGGVIDSRFMPSIVKGILEKMAEGPLTGSYVRDIRVAVYDGKMHPVDSNDISFKIAGMQAFKEAFHQASPRLLEPIYEIEAEAPEQVMGSLMSELQTCRSIITGMDSKDGVQIIRAKTPLAELDELNQALRGLSQGKARIRSRFSEYAPVPIEIQQRLMNAYGDQEAP